MVTMHLITTFTTLMNSLRQFLVARVRSIFGASLRCPFVVNLSKRNISLVTHLFKDIPKRSKPSIKSMLSQHTLAHDAEVDILNEYHSCLVTEMMSCLIVELLPSVSDVVMMLSNC